MRVLTVVKRVVMLPLLLALVPSAKAQTAEIRGVVRDSANGTPIAGVVVVALDALGETLARTITSERGQYRLNRPGATMMVRALRLGYRPVTERLPAIRTASLTLDLALATIPRTLEAMEVVAAQGCPVRSDRTEAYALLDQARAGLLAAVVARERQPATLQVLRFERYLDLDGIDIERQLVRLDSSRNASTSFNAVRSAVDFVSRGFRTGAPGQYTYLGPDADVLLDERFQRGYCFSVAAADTSRATQVGLRFSPAARRGGRVDIDGTLWVDTAARALTDIEFTYLGVEALAEAFRSGGRVHFVTLPNGSPIIQQWSLRLVGAPDTLVTDVGVSSQVYAIREIGGELVRARWPDGQSWTGPLSSVHLTAVTSRGEPARFVKLSLAGTDYRGTTDSVGRSTIPMVLPGPYKVMADDDRLSAVGLQIPSERALTVQRSSAALLRVVLPTAEEFVGLRCNRTTTNVNDAWLLTRVFDSDGKPAAGAHWRVSEQRDGKWRVISDGGTTGADGVVALCRGLELRTTIEVAAWRDAKDAVKVRRTLSDRLSVVRVALPALVVASATPRTGGPFLVASGTVRDSSSNAPIADARVTFLGTPYEGATDSSGVFVIGGLGAGDYTVEVSTPWLDSIGAVHRTRVVLTDRATPLSLFTPTVASALTASCGSADVPGAVVGHVSARAATAMPLGLRVVAEWADTTRDADGSARAARRAWTRAPVEESGTFRLCGVPADVPIVLTTEADSTTALASAPIDIRVRPELRFARADLVLDSVATGVASWTGTVIADTTGVPIENAEVTITDIGKSILTDRRGGFRLSEIPAGIHLVSIKRIGYAPMISSVEFEPNRAVEQRVLLSTAPTLATIAVTAEGLPTEFEERRKVGVGRFLGRTELDKNRGRRLGDLISMVGGFGAASSSAGRAWVVGKRVPIRNMRGSNQGASGCGAAEPSRDPAKAGQTPVCNFTMDDLRNQGIYCPTAAEQAQGILSCACFSQVYVDNRLMNPGKPTEPFDANALAVEEIAGVEFFATPASTPARYNQLNASCGVMLVWTRQR